MQKLVWIFLILLQQHGGLGEDADLPKTTVLEIHDGPKLVKRYAKDPFSRRSGVDKNFIRFGRSGDYFHEPPDRSHKNLMSYSRVSRAARDNFMRFGRPEEELRKMYTSLPITTEKDRFDDMQRLIRAKDSFMRFGRGKDNFMRFGRGKDNFMRFGRGKDNFMRFGRAKDNFMRFGRAKDNFMRFGRAKDSFMRFGRGNDNFMRFGRNYPSTSIEPKDLSATEIFDPPTGKKQTKSLKNQSGFIRFGRSDPDADPEDLKIDDDDSEIEGGGLDLQGDKPKNGPIIRIKREAQATLWDVENDRSRRDLEVMDQIEAEPTENLKNPELQKRYVDVDSYFEPGRDFIVSDDDLPEFLSYYSNPDIFSSERKRSNGGSNFIRFG